MGPARRAAPSSVRPPPPGAGRGGASIELARFVRPDHVPGSPAAKANELGLRSVAFEVDDLFVWGFTAMLLSSLFDLAGLALPWDVALERPLPDRVMSPWMRGTQE